MGAKRKISDRELEAHLQEQIEFLELSCASFDNGVESEAKRLAVHLRTLFHDSKSSKSLLGQLGKLNSKFLDSAIPLDPESLTAHGGLVCIACGPPKTRYVAMLDDVPQNRWLTFSDWWETPVFLDADRRQLSRKDLVRTAADQDGGAHVDPALEAAYYELSKENSLSWFASDEAELSPLVGPEKAAIRQIAHETLKSLKPGYRKAPSHQAQFIVGGSIVVKTVPASTMKNRPTQNRSFSTRKPGRNQPCPCGSGTKYKRCHGST